MLRHFLRTSLEEFGTKEIIREEASAINITELMRKRRLEWLGNVCWGDRKEDFKRVMKSMQYGGKRIRGKQMYRWKDITRKTLKCVA